jgi:hypothetical protein
MIRGAVLATRRFRMNSVLGMGSVFALVLVVQAPLMMVVREMIVLAAIAVYAALILM